MTGTAWLLKDLHLHLSHAAQGTTLLREQGWYDFRNLDRPDTADPIELAASAFVYLSKDRTGRLAIYPAIIGGVLAFLADRLDYFPDQHELINLKKEVTRPRSQEAPVIAWFRDVYGPQR